MFRKIEAAGYRGGTILTPDFLVGGNLRLYFPQARILCMAYPAYEPPPKGADGPSVVVWDADRPAAIERSNRATIESLGEVPVACLPPTTPATLADAGAHLPLDDWL